MSIKEDYGHYIHTRPPTASDEYFSTLRPLADSHGETSTVGHPEASKGNPVASVNNIKAIKITLMRARETSNMPNRHHCRVIIGILLKSIAFHFFIATARQYARTESSVSHRLVQCCKFRVHNIQSRVSQSQS